MPPEVALPLAGLAMFRMREKGSPMSTSETRPSTTPGAGDRVTATRPDGVAYRALLQRYDGPRGGIAVLYALPVDAPDADAMYEHSVYVKGGIGPAAAPVCGLVPDGR